MKEEFRRSVVERMANAHEVTTENVEEWWEETAGLIRSCGEEVCGRQCFMQRAVMPSSGRVIALWDGHS